MIGLLGQRIIILASFIASVTPGAGAALSIFLKITFNTSGFIFRLTKYSWKCISPSSVTIHVSTSSSVIGRTVMPSFKPKALASSDVT